MSDRRVDLRAIVLCGIGLFAAMLLAPSPTPAQSLDELRTQLAEASRRATLASQHFNGRNDSRRTLDRRLVVEGITFDFADGELSTDDTVSLRRDVTAGLATMREQHGDAAVTLMQGTRWGLQRVQAQRMFRRVPALQVNRAGSPHAIYRLSTPTQRTEVLEFLRSAAGERLVESSPALSVFAGWSAFRPDEQMLAEVARRMAVAWSGTARRCASGATDSCAALLSPFEERGAVSRYYDPGDYQAVVAAARLPALGDSAYFNERRRCIDGNEQACMSIVQRVDLPDPFNPMVRGTALTHAIQVGGRDAVARALAVRDSNTIAALGRIAGVSSDSLVRSWHTAVFSALETERGAASIPLMLTSLAWGLLWLVASMRRRYL